MLFPNPPEDKRINSLRIEAGGPYTKKRERSCHGTSLADDFFFPGGVKDGSQEFQTVILFKPRLVAFEMGRAKQRQSKAAGPFAFLVTPNSTNPSFAYSTP